MNTTSTKKKAIKLAIVAVTALVAVNAAAMSFTYTAPADSYTIYSDDEYYSETTHYLTESAYNEYLEEQAQTPSATSPKTTRASSTISNTSAYENNKKYKFVSASVKNVWVNEIADEYGNISESTLMSKSEIDALNNASADYNGTQTASLNSVTRTTASNDDDVHDDSVHNEDNQYGDEDSQSFERLTTKLVVYYDTENNEYHAVADAQWKAEWVWYWEGRNAAEENNDDRMCITWGGNNSALLGKNESFSGYYHSNYGNVEHRKEISEDNSGFVWAFREKSGFAGKEMANAVAEVVLEPVKDLEDPTSIKYTYIHTYGSFDVSGEVIISISEDPEISAGIQIGMGEEHWQVQMSVPNIIVKTNS